MALSFNVGVYLSSEISCAFISRTLFRTRLLSQLEYKNVTVHLVFTLSSFETKALCEKFCAKTPASRMYSSTHLRDAKLVYMAYPPYIWHTLPSFILSSRCTSLQCITQTHVIALTGLL